MMYLEMKKFVDSWIAGIITLAVCVVLAALALKFFIGGTVWIISRYHL